MLLSVLLILTAATLLYAAVAAAIVLAILIAIHTSNPHPAIPIRA